MLDQVAKYNELINKTIPILKTSVNGFHACLDNGYRVSVQWGAGTYSDNHDVILRGNIEQWINKPLKSKTAEVAVFNPAGELIETPFSDGDTIIGWVYPDKIAQIITWAKNITDRIACPYCGMENNRSERECHKCGAPVSTKKK